MITKEQVITKTEEARNSGVKRFSIVTSGRKASKKELKSIAPMIGGIREKGLLPCASLGLLNKDELKFLKEHGLERYHHNLEASERLFPSICSTHTYGEKIKTIEAARSLGLSVCSGGIFGMGEAWQDRIDMAFALRALNVDSVPINFLIPIKGTPLGNRETLSVNEALKIISLYRLILPDKRIRICGGRMQVLGDSHAMIFAAGADALMTGNYLTTTGRSYDDDVKMIEGLGLKVMH